MFMAKKIIKKATKLVIKAKVAAKPVAKKAAPKAVVKNEDVQDFVTTLPRALHAKLKIAAAKHAKANGQTRGNMSELIRIAVSQYLTGKANGSLPSRKEPVKHAAVQPAKAKAGGVRIAIKPKAKATLVIRPKIIRPTIRAAVK